MIKQVRPVLSFLDGLLGCARTSGKGSGIGG